MAESAKPATELQLGAFQRRARLGGMAVSKDPTQVESVSPLADPEWRLKSRMLGNPLVRFCEGQGGNLVMVLVTHSQRAPCLLDPGFNRVTEGRYWLFLTVFNGF